MSIRSYRELKSQIETNRRFIQYLKEHNISGEDIADYVKMTEKDLKKDTRDFYRYKRKFCNDPLSVPLRNNEKQWRTVADDFDSRTDFIIIPDKWGDLWDSENEEDYQTIADDIEYFVFTTVGYRSMYDFPTGQMITYNWYFTRTPCGVAVIHRCGIDW